MMKVARGNAPGIYLFDGNTSDQIINGACYIHCFAVFCNYNLIRLVEGSLQPFPVRKTRFSRTYNGF